MEQEPAAAAASEPAAPTDAGNQPVAQSTKNNWYDGPVTADATSDRPGQEDAAGAAPPDHAEPNRDDRAAADKDAGDKKSGEGEQSNLLMDGVKAKQALARVYADFKSEGLELNKGGKAAIDTVTKLLDKALDDVRSGGEFDHQALRDGIVSQGVDALKNAHADAAKNQRDVWNKLNDGWKTETRNEFGPKIDRTLGTAKAVIEEFGGTPEQQKALMAHLNNNGMGNYAGFVRLLANIGSKLNVYEDFTAADPAGASGRMNSARGSSRSQRWYGNQERG